MSGNDAFIRANELQMAGKLEEAEELYDQILSQNPDNHGLLATLATLYLTKGKPGLAICLYHRALENKVYREPAVYSNLGLAYKRTGQTEKALHYLEKSATMKGATPETMTCYGSMFIEAGDTKKPIELFDKALQRNPKLALAHWNKSLCLLADGQWETAWDEYDWGFAANQRVDRKWGDIPVWDGTPGKTVWVYGEQGIGDEIMFASMIPDLMKDCTVIIESHKRLVTLFEKSFGCKVYGTREEKDITWPADHKIDARISIASLGKFYRNSADKFNGKPYLKAEPAIGQGRKLRVGISWTGGMKAGRVRKRTVPLSWWESILSNNCEFISLQYTDCAEEIAMMRDKGYDIEERNDLVKADDYAETARLVASCDLVISVCTSVIHLAGALGVPCWVLTPKYPAWRYQNKGRMPWYRSVRLYRQPEETVDAWIPVVQRIGLDLMDLTAAKIADKVAA